jgi:hypothetical protein
VTCLAVDLPRGKNTLLPTGKSATYLLWCWSFSASKVGSFPASAEVFSPQYRFLSNTFDQCYVWIGRLVPAS